MALQDGTLNSANDVVRGANGGVAVIATNADTLARLHSLRTVRIQGPRIQKFECCGFTASVKED